VSNAAKTLGRVAQRIGRLGGEAPEALAQHFGHRDRAITDTGYVGTDYSLQHEIETEVLEQSVAAIFLYDGFHSA
jgi:hypothetical protein